MIIQSSSREIKESGGKDILKERDSRSYPKSEGRDTEQENNKIIILTQVKVNLLW